MSEPAAEDDAQETLGNAFIAQMMNTQATDGPDDEAPTQGPASPAAEGELSGLQLFNLFRFNDFEYRATMECLPVDFQEPSPYEGEQIVERFSSPWASQISDDDLRAEPGMPQTVAEVMQHVHTGDPGIFTVEENGQFIDYHGGHGFDTGSFVDWFTPQALVRGIGWQMKQRYIHQGNQLNVFMIERTIKSSNGLTITKVE